MTKRARPRIEVRTIRKYLDLFPAELGLRGTGTASDQGPDFAIFTCLVDEYWLVDLRRRFRTRTPEELDELYGRFYITGEDGQEVTVGLYKLEGVP
jgi:hypothetical protein